MPQNPHLNLSSLKEKYLCSGILFFSLNGPYFAKPGLDLQNRLFSV